MDGHEHEPRTYTRTPLVKRLPPTGVLAVSLILAMTLGLTPWLRLLIFATSNVVGIAILHLVFKQPLERLLQYREFTDE